MNSSIYCFTLSFYIVIHSGQKETHTIPPIVGFFRYFPMLRYCILNGTVQYMLLDIAKVKYVASSYEASDRTVDPW